MWKMVDRFSMEDRYARDWIAMPSRGVCDVCTLRNKSAKHYGVKHYGVKQNVGVKGAYFRGLHAENKPLNLFSAL